MDDIVLQAMAKWPGVPHCFGWLGLDARGRWFLRDEQAQARGAFASGIAGARGVLLAHEKLVAFIGRNYEPDEQGRWFFQNGPQRVFVELEATPWIFRIYDDWSVRSHTGKTASAEKVLVDEDGRSYLLTDLGPGLVHTQDVGLVADALQAGRWALEDVSAHQLPQRFAYVMSPQAAAGLA